MQRSRSDVGSRRNAARLGEPGHRDHHGAVWTGSEMILWCGSIDDGVTPTGGRYDAAQDQWRSTTLLRSPQVLWGGNWSTVWTGAQMLVWGGLGPTQKGALYCASDRPNDAPSAVADACVARSGRALVVGTASGVLVNDSDPNGDPRTARLVSGPAHGTLVLNPNGSFSYRSAAGYRGPDGFSYRVNDDLADSTAVTVSLDVR